jgi:hypothetical protein
MFIVGSASNDTLPEQAIEMPTPEERAILLFHLTHQVSLSHHDGAAMGGNPPAVPGRLCEESPIDRRRGTEGTDKRRVKQAVGAPGNRSRCMSVRARQAVQQGLRGMPKSRSGALWRSPIAEWKPSAKRVVPSRRQLTRMSGAFTPCRWLQRIPREHLPCREACTMRVASTEFQTG